MVRRCFFTGFKHESVYLVLDQVDSIGKVSKAIDVGETALRRLVKQLRAERE